MVNLFPEFGQILTGIIHLFSLAIIFPVSLEIKSPSPAGEGHDLKIRCVLPLPAGTSG
jgi:hypothetical protein